MAERLKVGIVDFLNSKPLAWGFLQGAFDDRIEPSYHPPAEVADLLAAGAIDVGLIPSIEALRIPGCAVIPGTCVAATREVRSVLLLLRRPISAVQRIALDSNSRTSIALLEILLADLWQVEPDLEVRPQSASGVPEGFDAALIIGDPALRVDRSSFEVVDLAAAWRRLTGLPFVFAVWATRQGLSPDGLATYFERSRAAGCLELRRIVQQAVLEQGLVAAEVTTYLTENLRFVLGPEEIAGLREFWSTAKRHGLVDRAEPSGPIASEFAMTASLASTSSIP